MAQSKPPITSTVHPPPFDKLSPRDFERLCLWLVEREGWERAKHLGAAGRIQGRDIPAGESQPGASRYIYQWRLRQHDRSGAYTQQVREILGEG